MTTQFVSIPRLLIALAALAAVLLPALSFAQDAPVPSPRPMFRSLADAADTTDAQLPAEPTTNIVTTIPISPDSGGNSAAAAIAAATMTPQPVVLTAQITENSGNIGQGLIWRIFSTQTDASGQLIMEAKSEDAIAHLDLAPGQYVVHVAYGRAQASDTLVVAEGDNNKSIVLEAGALRLNAAITGDISIPINLLRFDVYAAGPTGDSESQRVQIAQNVSANDVLTLNAGTYHIVSYFGDINAVVKADLKVEPGQMTDATIYHRAAQVALKLVTEAGGEAVADVDWTVKTADGTTVFTNIGAFPSAVFEEGDYLVLAKRGDKVYNREFQVQPGQPHEIEVLTTVY